MPTKPSLDTVRSEIQRLASIVGAEQDRLPAIGKANDYGHPNIEVTDDKYHYVVVERGEEVERTTYTDLEDLLYRTLKDATFSLAGQHEQKHRISRMDYRRELFAEHVRLMTVLSPHWGEKMRQEVQHIVSIHPYADE